MYGAEGEYRHVLGTPLIRDVPLIQQWVNAIVNSEWRKERFRGIINVQAKDGRRRKYACCTYIAPMWWVIKLPRYTRSRLIILHELAHVFTSPLEPWHGKVFVGILLALVDRWMGQLEGLALRWFLSKNRVKWQERNGRKGTRDG